VGAGAVLALWVKEIQLDVFAAILLSWHALIVEGGLIHQSIAFGLAECSRRSRFP
jgi:hypothetical protein